MAAHPEFNGKGVSSSSSPARPEQSTVSAPWPAAGRAPSSGYGALNLKVTTPTQSRMLGYSVLLTLGGGNDPREAACGGAGRPSFDDGDIGSWWRSSSKKQSNSFLVTCSSSLIASIPSGGGKSSSRGDYLRALGFGVASKNSMSSSINRFGSSSAIK
jgi:hypothetical protein